MTVVGQRLSLMPCSDEVQGMRHVSRAMRAVDGRLVGSERLVHVMMERGRVSGVEAAWHGWDYWLAAPVGLRSGEH